MNPLPANLKRLVPLAFALAMGLAAVMLLRQYLGQQRQAVEQERRRLAADYQAPIEVVVAAKDLTAGVALEPSHLKMAPVPEKFVQPYAVRSPDELLGRLTLAPIAEDEQVLLNKVRRAEEAPPRDATLAGLMPKGKRAVTIAVDAITGVGGFVRPGDKVDILWTIQIPQPGQSQGQVVTMTLFQEVPVLAVGQETVGRARQQAERSADYTVTLALNPQETSFLLFAREQGKIQLSLRSKAETGPVAVVPANINTLMETVLGAPASSARAPRQVEVYKGLKRDVVQLPEE